MQSNLDWELPMGADAASGWREVHLDAGARLFAAGDPADTLFVVRQGRIGLFVADARVDDLGPGATLGEASAFFPGDTRRTTASALTPTTLWALDAAALRELRQHDPAHYDRVLDAALRATCAYLLAQSVEIARRSAGRVPAPRQAGPVKQLWQRVARRRAPAVERGAALARVPALAWLPGQQREQLAQAWEVQALANDEALLLEGDQDDRLYVLADGALEVMRSALRGEGAVPLARLGPGALVGVGAYLTGAPRSAAVVARGNAVLLSLSPAAAADLPPPVRRGLNEALLATLRAQLDAANRALAAVSVPADALGALLSAAAGLEAWQAGAPGHDARPEDLAAVVAPPEPPQRATFERVRTSIIGADTALRTPFGLRRIVYADYTASGRSISFIEDFLREQVMPLYANTHTEASASGLQTTRLREEAREVVARAMGAGPEDEVIFVGSGATGAIHKLIDLLGLRRPRSFSWMPPVEERGVVFISPYEHHSNILPWRDAVVDLVTIPVDADGLLDLAALERALIRYADRPLRIGSFSAGSNVTGVATDVIAVATLLHRHGALSFWDYAAAGPYLPIDLNPTGPGIDPALACKDAVFLSPHKFPGGPGTPGVLALKRHLVKRKEPTLSGGGTVDFVTGDDALYSDSLTHREEAGTPAILESIRCGLVFQLKESIGGAVIHAREQQLVQAAVDAWSRNPALRVLGPRQAERLSITSFLVRHGRGYLHHNFVVALLNDLFGIQARGGCSCAGPYGALLLGMQDADGRAYLELARKGLASLKPGWTRVNFNYFLSDAELRFIVQAVNLVALHGWALLPTYRFDIDTGLWSHRDGAAFQPVALSDLRLDGGEVHRPPPRPTLPEEQLDQTLATGRSLMLAAVDAVPDPIPSPAIDPDAERLRWFPLPHEVVAWLRHVHLGEDAPEALPLGA